MNVVENTSIELQEKTAEDLFLDAHPYELVLDLNPGTMRHVFRSSNPIQRLTAQEARAELIKHLSDAGNEAARYADFPTTDVIVKIPEDTYLVHPQHGMQYVEPGYVGASVIQEFNPWMREEMNVFD